MVSLGIRSGNGADKFFFLTVIIAFIIGSIVFAVARTTLVLDIWKNPMALFLGILVMFTFGVILSFLLYRNLTGEATFADWIP